MDNSPQSPGTLPWHSRTRCPPEDSAASGSCPGRGGATQCLPPHSREAAISSTSEGGSGPPAPLGGGREPGGCQRSPAVVRTGREGAKNPPLRSTGWRERPLAQEGQRTPSGGAAARSAHPPPRAAALTANPSWLVAVQACPAARGRQRIRSVLAESRQGRAALCGCLAGLAGGGHPDRASYQGSCCPGGRLQSPHLPS